MGRRRWTIAILAALPILVFVLTTTGGCVMNSPSASPSHQPARDFDRLWDYSDPAATLAKFVEYRETHGNSMLVEERLELETQIARCRGMQREFDDSHAILDRVESELAVKTPVARVRYHLERGRTLNSSGKKKEAEREFLAAWEQARKGALDGYAVDAAHMLGIVFIGDHEKTMEWNLRALDLAESSSDPAAQRWAGSLHNNIGWAWFDRGDYGTALGHFEKGLRIRERDGNADTIRVARWCVARCHRALGRVEEAIAIQRELESEVGQLENPDGFVYEELAELLTMMGEEDEARPYFQRAYELLSKDPWLVENEAERLNRLRTMAGL